ncbi:MAG: PIG-L deacetylase family protein [Ruthenibacterium lactatiformans]
MENPAFDVAALLAPPDILKSKCALCIQPHPDDNEIGMGGTVAVLAQAGCTVHYLTVTNGDQGNKNRTASPQETARVRRAEAIAAGTHLGAKAFHFLDLGDGTLDDVLGLSAQIARVIREVRPDAIFAPDPWLAYESHLDHAVTGRGQPTPFDERARRHSRRRGHATARRVCHRLLFYRAAQYRCGYFRRIRKKFEAIALRQPDGCADVGHVSRLLRHEGKRTGRG